MMLNQTLPTHSSLLVLLALALATTNDSLLAGDPGVESRFATTTGESTGGSGAASPRLLPTGSDDVPEFFPLNQIDAAGPVGAFSEDLVPTLLGDAGDPGFYASEAGLPEAAIIPPMK
ncbi:MAG TPA: hypothetical protein VL475_13405, partial [Planctomycetaceae bacterium]|nr:hypothetical protein [Planctomycetaceae bacterium]